jgi:uncharacterized protein (TIGR02466 family)
MSRPPGTEALRAELRARIQSEARALPGVQRSNIGGWHSPPDLFERTEPCFVALKELVFSSFRQALQSQGKARGRSVPAEVRLGGQAWAMVMGKGHYSAPHHHGDAQWASVFYVDAGDPPGDPSSPAGMLTFLDPRGGRMGPDPLDLFEVRQDLRPKDGLMLFFPAWLQHHVHPYGGRRPRVSVSSNLVVG